ncbi:hypothetical protein SASPL_123557 [Salvia splendens]|uniref:lysine--tRNA ligase n=1 Tax=Salvia splendens TaxID=180675 RepID=A0A8X8XQH7_SALSN|nr:hypothetical protein SASPL_123557 [Salvia splendens]
MEISAKPKGQAKKHAAAEDEGLDPTQYFENRIRAQKETCGNPYPHKFEVQLSIPEYVKKYESLNSEDRVEDVEVKIGGRIMNKRASSAKLLFYDLHGVGAKVQIMTDASKSELKGEDFSRFHSSVKRGDITTDVWIPGSARNPDAYILKQDQANGTFAQSISPRGVERSAGTGVQSVWRETARVQSVTSLELRMAKLRDRNPPLFRYQTLAADAKLQELIFWIPDWRYMGLSNMDELSFTDSELDNHVRNALKDAIQGDCDFYNQLVAVIHRKEALVTEEVALLVTCLKAMTGAVSCVHIVHHRSLLAAILSMSLWDYGTDVMDALVELLISLASSNGDYVDLCLEMLVMNFMPPPAHSARGLSRKIQVLDRVHSTLEDISNLVPLTPLRLQKIVRDKMPHIYMKEHVIMIYAENILRLESGVMGELVGSTGLVALMDKLIEFDVEISWEDIVQDDFHKDMFDIELEDLENPVDDIVQDGDEVISILETAIETLSAQFPTIETQVDLFNSTISDYINAEMSITGYSHGRYARASRAGSIPDKPSPLIQRASTNLHTTPPSTVLRAPLPMGKPSANGPSFFRLHGCARWITCASQYFLVQKTLPITA